MKEDKATEAIAKSIEDQFRKNLKRQAKILVEILMRKYKNEKPFCSNEPQKGSK